MTASISTLDRIDLKILDILQDDGKISRACHQLMEMIVDAK